MVGRKNLSRGSSHMILSDQIRDNRSKETRLSESRCHDAKCTLTWSITAC